MLLTPQLKNSDEIKKILKKIPETFLLADDRSVDVLLVYLPCQVDGKSCYIEFFDCVQNGILHNFVFSCSEVERKLGIQSVTAKEELLQKALRKMSQKTAKGELGELILFTLLDVYLAAPKLHSKISMKTSPKMPVFGADAIHGQFINGELRIYLGEAKLHAKFKGAATAAVKSIADAKSRYQIELDLIDSNMDFPNLSDELVEKIRAILNPYTSTDLADRIHSPCFIGFTQPDVLLSNESEYIAKYQNLALAYIADFFSKAENQGLNIDTVTLLMLPFSCVNELEKEFVNYLGIQK